MRTRRERHDCAGSSTATPKTRVGNIGTAINAQQLILVWALFRFGEISLRRAIARVRLRAIPVELLADEQAASYGSSMRSRQLVLRIIPTTRRRIRSSGTASTATDVHFEHWRFHAQGLLGQRLPHHFRP